MTVVQTRGVYSGGNLGLHRIKLCFFDRASYLLALYFLTDLIYLLFLLIGVAMQPSSTDNTDLHAWWPLAGDKAFFINFLEEHTPQ